MAVLKISLLLLTALIAVKISTVESVCCWTVKYTWSGSYCADGTKGTPYCGYGKCDWLGCDCAGGCRTASGKRSVETKEETVAQLRTLFKELDTDDDNELTKREVLSSAGFMKNGVDAGFAETDLDGDGKIVMHEFEKKNA